MISQLFFQFICSRKRVQEKEKKKKSNGRFVITRCLLYGFCDRDHNVLCNVPVTKVIYAT